MTTDPSAQDSPKPAGEFPTLEDLGLPAALHTLFPEKSRGLGLIAGTDAEQIQTTMAALAHSFEAQGRSTVLLRTDTESVPLPGIPEIYSNVLAFDAMLRAHGLNHVLFMDSADTKEKLTLAINAAMMGRVVVAPVISYDAETVIGSMIDLGINRFVFADVLRYIAQQTVLEDPFSSAGDTILDTYISVMDFSWKKLMWSYGR